MARLVERAPSRLQDPISQARQLVWALLIQGTFNDRELPALLERYGGSLATGVNDPILREMVQETLRWNAEFRG